MSEMKFDADGIIKTIQDGVKPEVIEAKVGDYTTKPIHRVEEKPFVPTLEVSSLTGLVDYVNKGIDDGTRKDIFVHVKDQQEVVIRNTVGAADDRRFRPLIAKADTPTLVFDRFVTKEEATVMLQSRFVDNDDLKELLKKLGTLVADEGLTQEDDGVTQTVTMQHGIKRSEASINNPVQLRPYRTFTEIEQPESPFIVRLKKDEQNGILVGLFEADGGAWRNAARLSIKAFLDSHINSVDATVIA